MSNSPVKYRHPGNHELEWSGKGRQPKWVEGYLANGGSMVSLDVSVQLRDEMEQLEDALDAAEMESDGIDLGIGEVVRSADTETANMNSRLADLGERTNAVLPEVLQDAGRQQLEVCLQEFGFQAMTAQEFIQSGVDYINQATTYACRAGVAFWAAQEALKTENESSTPGRSRTFEEWIEDAGLTKPRVYECIRIAKFYSRLPAENRTKALSIGKKHALLLASLPQEVIDQAAESGNDLIGKADLMTVAELKEEIKSLNKREKNYEAELERFKSQVKRLTEAKSRTTDFLLRTEEVREECMALQLGTELHLNSLKRLFEETDQEAPEGILQVEQLWVVANTVAARALDLLEFMRARVPDGMPERPMTHHMLTPEEAIRWLQDYPLIENRFEAEATLRKERRDATKPRGPGRPSGSKNKGAEE